LEVKKLLRDLEREQFIKNIWAGIIGGVFGAIIGFWYYTSLSIIVGTTLGILIGMGVQGLIIYTSHKTPQENAVSNQATFQLREEQLDISKKLIQTGKVSMRKEVITKKKIIVVPVTREELVIDQLDLDKEDMDESKQSTIRIPLSEERIEIIKHLVVLEDVEVYRRHLQETVHIEETIRREEVNIKANRNPKIIKK
jgi:uncharacterized protein (TIGR02271 family)